MANYRTADTLPVLEKPTENTYALVEENGTLKRVSGENLGGKSGCCVISIDKSSAAGPSGVESTDYDGTVYTCNMTYSELMDALQNKSLSSFSVNMYAGTEMYSGHATYIYFGSDASIMISWESCNNDYSGMLQFFADDTITEASGPS